MTSFSFLLPGARFSKVPRTFRARNAIRRTCLFCKAGLLIRCKGNRIKNNCKVLCLETPSFLRYKENYVTRKSPKKFRDLRETGPRFGFVLFQGLLRQHQSSLSSSQLHDVRVKWLNFILSLLFQQDGSGQVGLQADGSKHEPIVILALQNDPVIKIASGNDHTAALTKSGNIYTWGCAEQGQLGRIMGCFASRGGRRGLQYILNPKQVRDRRRGLRFKDVFCGSYSTFALAQDGAVFAWGLNNYGQLGTGDVETQYGPVKIESLTSLLSDECVCIASGQHHTIVLDAAGKVYAMGRAEYGRLGLGEDAKETSLPVLVTALESNPIQEIACGEAVSFALSRNGDLYSWGFGSCLQLGTAEDEDEFLPTKMEGKNLQSELHEVLGISAGGQHTVLLVKDRIKSDSLKWLRSAFCACDTGSYVKRCT